MGHFSYSQPCLGNPGVKKRFVSQSLFAEQVDLRDGILPEGVVSGAQICIEPAEQEIKSQGYDPVANVPVDGPVLGE
jgi:hypothetical protein